MSNILIALGLVFVLEGAAYALFPGGMKNMMAQMADVPDQTLRTMGLTAAFAGFALVWLVKG